MTKHEAALMLERLANDDRGLTPEAVEALMMGIDALEEADKSQWIPCSERMPDKNGQYLVTVGSSHRPIRVYDFDPWNMIEDRKYWRNEYDGHTHVFNHFVKAWMPLPAPYQPEEHADCTAGVCPIEWVLNGMNKTKI